MQNGHYYFGCTVNFDCPICGRSSSEKMVYEAGSPDPRRVADAISKRSFDCQQCGAARTEHTKLVVQVLPAELERLRILGFGHVLPPGEARLAA